MKTDSDALGRQTPTLPLSDVRVAEGSTAQPGTSHATTHDQSHV